MNEQNTNPHEALVREVAEEMGKEKWLTEIRTKEYCDLTTVAQEHLTKSHLYAARIAVTHMAEAYEEGFYIDSGESDFPTLWLPHLLSERGLISSPDQPEGTGK